MKKSWSWMVGALLLAAQSWAADLSDGLVAYYPLSADASDSSTNGMDGTAMSGVDFSNGYALFDGVDDYIDLPTGFSDLSGGFSFSGWVRCDSTDETYARIFDFSEGGPYNDNLILSRYNQSSKLFYQVYSSNIATGTVSAADFFELGTWQHITMIHNPDLTVEIYQDGELVSSATDIPLPESVMRVDNFIGKSNWSADGYFKGAMAELRFYDRALDADEISTLYSVMYVPPIVDITTPNQVVEWDTTIVTLSGTNSTSVTALTWTNAANGESGACPVLGSTFRMYVSPLAYGTNLITVIGENAQGIQAADQVQIVREDPSNPIIDLTTTDQTVAWTTETVELSGTNNASVTTLFWTNAANEASGNISFSDLTFEVSSIPLEYGTNLISVIGENDLGAQDSDQVQIVREDPPNPVIDITTTNQTVDWTTETVELSGTHNASVTTLFWTNAANEASGNISFSDLTFEVSSIPLEYGTNLISVIGENMFGETGSDQVQIVREDPSNPIIDLTTTDQTVAWMTATAELSGTNNASVISLIWTNSANEASGNISVSSDEFQVSDLPLAVGTNLITVIGENDLGAQDSDQVQIVREDAPPVDVADGLVAYYPLAEHAVDASGNSMDGTVMSGVIFTNGYALFDGSTNAYVDLPDGFDCFTNGFSFSGWVRYDSFDQAYSRIFDFSEGGTQNDNVFLSNSSTDSGLFYRTYEGSTASSVEIDDFFKSGEWQYVSIVHGSDSVVTVYLNGTLVSSAGGISLPTHVSRVDNVLGKTNGNSQHFTGGMSELRFYDRALDEDEINTLYSVDVSNYMAVIDILSTNQTVFYETDTIDIIGTNASWTVGTLVWTNAANGESGSFSATGGPAYSWQVSSIPLAFGANTITVSGTNVLGRTGSDTITITRYIESGADNLTHYVSEGGSHSWPFDSWATAATNIQDAVDAAAAGDTVLVDYGDYQEGATITIAKAITLESYYGADWTTIDGEDAYRCLTLSDAGVVIDGFTIKNGYSRYSFGGGIFCSAGGGTIQDCTLTKNYAWCGGGISGCSLIRCTLTGNSAGNKGGGIYCSASTVQNCTISYNTAASEGGGIYSSGSTVENCTIFDNEASDCGGGIYSDGGTVANCTVSGNSSSSSSYSYGGGIYSDGGTVANCTVSGNTSSSSSSSSYGGGIYSYGGTVATCTVSGNISSSSSSSSSYYYSDSYGGGIYSYGGTIANCTVSGNTSSSYSEAYGGGMYCKNSSYVNNTIVWDNSLDADYEYGPNCYNDDDNSSFNYTCTTPSIGENCITNDPCFTDADNGDYTLLSSSPCINAGNNSYVTTDIDLAGNVRIFNGTVDLGAYEYVTGTDTDGDGIPDSWEMSYFSSVVDCVTTADSDEDVFNNLEEYIAGTDPTDAASYFHVTNCATTTEGFLVEWESVNGRVYSVWHTVSLTNDFTQLTNNIAYPASSCVVETDGTNGFFRVEVELEE